MVTVGDLRRVEGTNQFVFEEGGRWFVYGASSRFSYPSRAQAAREAWFIEAAERRAGL